MAFQKATKSQAKLRLALIGPAGSGKTYTALRIAKALGKRVALIDSERGSASHYANDFEFDTCPLESFSPQRYVDAIHEAEQEGYDVVIVDSLSHAWMGKDGALEMVDKAAKRSQSGNSFGAWREVTPLHNQLVDAMVGCRVHIIVTLRAKMEYVQEKDERTGKTTIRKVGLQPVQRDGLEYEFDVIADLTTENDCIISKTRCKELTGKIFNKPGENDLAPILRAWLSDGAPVVDKPVLQPQATVPTPSSNGHTLPPTQRRPEPPTPRVIEPEGKDKPASAGQLATWDKEWAVARDLGFQPSELPARPEHPTVGQLGLAFASLKQMITERKVALEANQEQAQDEWQAMQP